MRVDGAVIAKGSSLVSLTPFGEAVAFLKPYCAWFRSYTKCLLGISKHWEKMLLVSETGWEYLGYFAAHGPRIVHSSWESCCLRVRTQDLCLWSWEEHQSGVPGGFLQAFRGVE